MKQTRKMLLLLALLIPAGAMAQDNERAVFTRCSSKGTSCRSALRISTFFFISHQNRILHYSLYSKASPPSLVSL